MTLAEYETAAMSTAVFPDYAATLYPLLGLIGEVGELSDAVEAVGERVGVLAPGERSEFIEIAAEAGAQAKALRDRSPDDDEELRRFVEIAAKLTPTEAETKRIRSELSDCLWMIAALARRFGGLELVAAENLAKLRGRAERGTLRGSGDDR